LLQLAFLPAAATESIVLDHKQPCRPADHKTHSAEDAAITRSAVTDLNIQQKYQILLEEIPRLRKTFKHDQRR
jgi:hypothetical protein